MKKVIKTVTGASVVGVVKELMHYNELISRKDRTESGKNITDFVYKGVKDGVYAEFTMTNGILENITEIKVVQITA